ncbi:MAG: glycoside hydrolase family 5 protein [Lentisphaerae bacterium]|nr:glycoside hydrolase family 5 protein [Lentisphaerota bacterium]
MLQVKGNRIVNARGKAVRLRGTCIGGWMNMENFIDGYPGAVHAQREALIREIGVEKTTVFFERFLDHFFTEADVKFLRACGANVIRIPVNYRHFEDDAKPFAYKDEGFARLDRTLGWCRRHGLYVIIDLHAVQGYQNPDWHSDNATNYSLFWQHPHFQDRFVALWEAFARRYRGQGVVAGYNVMNEPVTSLGSNNRTPYTAQPETDWAALNGIYARVVKAIRAIDPDHIVFLEGDHYSSLFQGLEAPFAPNLVYSSHNYMGAGLGPGAYPGPGRDKRRVAAEFRGCEGAVFTRRHRVPLWVGEFGAVFNGPAAEIPDRLRGLDDQITAMEATGAHWTTWTYKDVGVMGMATFKPDSAYMRTIRPVFEAKRRLQAEGWGWLAPSAMGDIAGAMHRLVADELGDPAIGVDGYRWHLNKVALCTYVAGILQTPFARCFRGMSEARLDRTMQSLRFENCSINAGQVAVLKRHFKRPA